jgi:hypothetical protein
VSKEKPSRPACARATTEELPPLAPERAFVGQFASTSVTVVISSDFNIGVIQMNSIRRILSVLFSLFLTLSALPAGAVSFNSTWHAARENSGTDVQNMTSSNTTFCYLSRVGVGNTDIENETATCRVTRGTHLWVLEAILGQNNDADVDCSAICYNN